MEKAVSESYQITHCLPPHSLVILKCLPETLEQSEQIQAFQPGRFMLDSQLHHLVILHWVVIKFSGLQISHLQNNDKNSCLSIILWWSIKGVLARTQLLVYTGSECSSSVDIFSCKFSANNTLISFSSIFCCCFNIWLSLHLFQEVFPDTSNLAKHSSPEL